MSISLQGPISQLSDWIDKNSNNNLYYTNNSKRHTALVPLPKDSR
jgi:hypothetical protein